MGQVNTPIDEGRATCVIQTPSQGSVRTKWVGGWINAIDGRASNYVHGVSKCMCRTYVR